jgi:lysophospholipase L1-like esterase
MIGSTTWNSVLKIRSLDSLRFATGGNLAYNALQRLPKLISCNPDYVVILIGGNDVMTSMQVKSTYMRLNQISKNLPQKPTSDWFKENFNAIVTGLKSKTHARIVLISMPTWGENLTSAYPFQSELNKLFAEYTRIIKDVATSQNVSYLPFYERMFDLVSASPGRAMTGFTIFPFYRDIFRQLVLRKSNDEIGKLNGWKFHRDGIHLNSASGKILADMVQGFLDGDRKGK